MSHNSMTYYEELGLTPAATEEDIRKAHRTLSKLLHPDQQTDPGLRQAAEVQMRRINGIIDVLMDEQRRKEYDESLVERRPDPAPLAPRPRLLDRLKFEDSPLGVLTTAVTAIALTAGAVWFLAGDSVHFKTSAAVAPVIVQGSGPAPVRAVAPTPQKLVKKAPQHARAGEESRREVAEAVHDDISAKTDISLPSVPAPVAIDPPSASPPDRSRLDEPARPPLAGTWMYAPPPQKSAAKMPLYEPEYIQLRIRLSGDRLYGEYSSQYRIPDRAISSYVKFSFQGRAAGQTTFEWRATDGSRGIIELDLLSQGGLRVNWRVTGFGSSIGLGAGTAVLIRRIGT